MRIEAIWQIYCKHPKVEKKGDLRLSWTVTETGGEGWKGLTTWCGALITIKSAVLKMRVIIYLKFRKFLILRNNFLLAENELDGFETLQIERHFVSVWKWYFL